MRRRPKHPVPTLLAVATVTLIFGQAALSRQPRAADPELDALISTVIDAYGGEEALRAVRGYHAVGKQWASQSHQPMLVERWFGRPDRLRLELEYPDHHETRITAGALGWTGPGTGALEPAIPVKLLAMRLQTARLDLPLRLLEQRAGVERRGADTAGRAVLRIPIDTGLYMDYHVDPKDHRITRMTTGMTGPPAMEFITDYSEFHEVDGVWIPFREITYAGNTRISEILVTDFDWNPEGLESALRPDEGGWD